MAFIYTISINLVKKDLSAENHFYKLLKGPFLGLRQVLATEALKKDEK